MTWTKGVFPTVMEAAFFEQRHVPTMDQGATMMVGEQAGDDDGEVVFGPLGVMRGIGSHQQNGGGVTTEHVAHPVFDPIDYGVDGPQVVVGGPGFFFATGLF